MNCLKDVDMNEIISMSLWNNNEYVDELFRRLYPLIKSSIRKYCTRCDIDEEDLIQEGYVMILRCLSLYDDTMGVHFLAYVKSRLKFLYKNIYRSSKFHTSLDEPAFDRDGCRVSLLDTIESSELSIEDMIMLRADCDRLYDCIKKLSDRERQILVLFYFNDMSIQNIAMTLGIAYRTVVNIKCTAIHKLRDMLKGGE